MNALERERKILHLLEEKDYLMVEDLAQMTGASEATIRRDLRNLEAQNKVCRFHGGVSSVEKSSPTNFNVHEIYGDTVENKEIKQIIAREAASHVKPYETLYIDGGSTTYYASTYLRPLEGLLVVTNSLLVALQCAQKDIKTFILAGELRKVVFSTIDQETLTRVSSMNFDKAFIGARGVDPQGGFTSPDAMDSLLKSAVISRSQQVFVLADHTKFNVRKVYSFAKLTDAVLITDEHPASKGYTAPVISVSG